jgi:hypothetical protein
VAIGISHMSIAPSSSSESVASVAASVLASSVVASSSCRFAAEGRLGVRTLALLARW